jgi:hypothetical protein
MWQTHTQDCFDNRTNWLTRIEYPGIPYYYLPTGDYADVDMKWKVGGRQLASHE